MDFMNIKTNIKTPIIPKNALYLNIIKTRIRDRKNFMFFCGCLVDRCAVFYLYISEFSCAHVTNNVAKR